mmetsp:Transcript_51233/g.122769  ORF Transcript_51233/g.122769 Transcript_51233/m.122769 type:complete len:340 (-) Transcript_51233:1305-2324(-)
MLPIPFAHIARPLSAPRLQSIAQAFHAHVREAVSQKLPRCAHLRTSVLLGNFGLNRVAPHERDEAAAAHQARPGRVQCAPEHAKPVGGQVPRREAQAGQRAPDGGLQVREAHGAVARGGAEDPIPVVRALVHPVGASFQGSHRAPQGWLHHLRPGLQLQAVRSQRPVLGRDQALVLEERPNGIQFLQTDSSHHRARGVLLAFDAGKGQQPLPEALSELLQAQAPTPVSAAVLEKGLPAVAAVQASPAEVALQRRLQGADHKELLLLAQLRGQHLLGRLLLGLGGCVAPCENHELLDGHLTGSIRIHSLPQPAQLAVCHRLTQVQAWIAFPHHLRKLLEV